MTPVALRIKPLTYTWSCVSRITKPVFDTQPNPTGWAFLPSSQFDDCTVRHLCMTSDIFYLIYKLFLFLSIEHLTTGVNLRLTRKWLFQFTCDQLMMASSINILKADSVLRLSRFGLQNYLAYFQRYFFKTLETGMASSLWEW